MRYMCSNEVRHGRPSCKQSLTSRHTHPYCPNSHVQLPSAKPKAQFSMPPSAEDAPKGCNYSHLSLSSPFAAFTYFVYFYLLHLLHLLHLTHLLHIVISVLRSTRAHSTRGNFQTAPSPTRAPAPSSHPCRSTPRVAGFSVAVDTTDPRFASALGSQTSGSAGTIDLNTALATGNTANAQANTPPPPPPAPAGTPPTPSVPAPPPPPPTGTTGGGGGSTAIIVAVAVAVPVVGIAVGVAMFLRMKTASSSVSPSGRVGWMGMPTANVGGVRVDGRLCQDKVDNLLVGYLSHVAVLPVSPAILCEYFLLFLLSFLLAIARRVFCMCCCDTVCSGQDSDGPKSLNLYLKGGQSWAA